ncbi:MAG: phenylalanine--tRNA ligase subunit alpha [Clostridium sp.]|jgi:phenylalanyl-tRNA synthetase alpha chain|nr:phenylalanine--tRNA ligase subunit alpha [Clostridium sp.]
MLEKLEQLKLETLEQIRGAHDQEELNGVRQSVMGKKGSLTGILKGLGKLSPDERKTVGQAANVIKKDIGDAISQRSEELISQASVIDYEMDLTLPGIQPKLGGLHPITQMGYDLNDAFHSLGFEVYEEVEITSEKYAFDHLNFPPAHPARESMDTFWIKGTEDKEAEERLCLRPHLTGGSVRYLKDHGAPARFVYPGRVYRNENTDARHERAFYQYEALIVEKDFSFAAGKLLVKTVLEKVFGQEVDVRMRAGFFPFVEPGFEIDMKCLVCGGEGCKVCKHVGWIEVMPGGVPHPNVLKSAGLDPVEWTGFYINIGLDRLVMMRYGVDDVRLFHSTDLRFLTQFK